VLGGALWITGAIVTALKPEGCVGAECDLPGRSMREGGSLDGALAIIGVLLIALGATAVVSRAREAGRLGTLGRVGLLFGIAGAALLLIAGLVQAIFFGGDFPYMPLFVLRAGWRSSSDSCSWASPCCGARYFPAGRVRSWSSGRW
jgi:hypothetical protein